MNNMNTSLDPVKITEMAPSHVMDTGLVIFYQVIWPPVNSIVCVHYCEDQLSCTYQWIILRVGYVRETRCPKYWTDKCSFHLCSNLNCPRKILGCNNQRADDEIGTEIREQRTEELRETCAGEIISIVSRNCK